MKPPFDVSLFYSGAVKADEMPLADRKGDMDPKGLLAVRASAFVAATQVRGAPMTYGRGKKDSSGG